MNPNMEFDILEFAEGAKRASGLAVIIDVFRAFSVACYAAEGGASGIIATASVEEAFNLKRKYKNSVLVGERNERKIDGFDYGNSPTEILKADIKGKIVIHTTTAGTTGLVNAVNADQILAGSFVNASSTAEYIKRINPQVVSFVAMGYRANESAAEDLLCAEYIISLLLDDKKQFSERISGLRYSSGERFFNPVNIEFSPPTDFFLCTMPNRFSFVLKAFRRHDGNMELERIDI
ncbi:MAG TPA: 2-phosphosulfolactate phosphatase [Bacteroidales bacterium]|jgi:2-phosphosulfolactate phosphatase|nr:2-phosphosulfolactate phosphatase [Bacteroidales bacterium]HQG78015.1 2-phosphosulfolactate phosphatase [Bacteroidales bacterium]